MVQTGSCKAEDIATRNPDYRTIDESPDEVLAWLLEEDYDSAPIYANGQPIGYVTPDMLEEADDGRSLAEAARTIDLDTIIANDAPLETVLKALYERPFYYLGGRNQVTGVLTRADLNKEPVYRQLYTAPSQLEHAFRDIILTHAPGWKKLPAVTTALDDIEDRHSNAKAIDVALDQIHYAQFSTLVTIISSVEDCWNVLGFDADHQASSQLSAIVDLRNDVAHQIPIIQNTDASSIGAGRIVDNLREEYSRIQSLLLRSNTLDINE